MKTNCVSVLLCAVAVIFFCGCEEDPPKTPVNTYPVMDSVQTGVTPSLGGYLINARGQFSVVATNRVRYSYDRYAYYEIPIHNGGISFSNGEYHWLLNGTNVLMQDESGNCSPTDGFAIWAQWTSPNHCEGLIWYHSDPAIPFSADR